MSYEPDKGTPNAVKRLADRGRYDQETIFSILDQGDVAHCTFQLPADELTEQDYPVIIPMIYARKDDVIYLHGHLSSRLLKTLSRSDVKACVSVTLVHGLVIVR